MSALAKTIISVVLSACLCAGGYLGTRQIITGGDFTRPRDNTRHTPESFSWTGAGNRDMENSSFLAGKYMRSDGNSVLYIDYEGSGDSFVFELFVVAEATQNELQRIGTAGIGGLSAAYADPSASEAILFTHIREGVLEIESDIPDDFAPPDGTYYIVRAKYVDSPRPQIIVDTSGGGGLSGDNSILGRSPSGQSGGGSVGGRLFGGNNRDRGDTGRSTTGGTGENGGESGQGGASQTGPGSGGTGQGSGGTGQGNGLRQEDEYTGQEQTIKIDPDTGEITGIQYPTTRRVDLMQLRYRFGPAPSIHFFMNVIQNVPYEQSFARYLTDAEIYADFTELREKMIGAEVLAQELGLTSQSERRAAENLINAMIAAIENTKILEITSEGQDSSRPVLVNCRIVSEAVDFSRVLSSFMDRMQSLTDAELSAIRGLRSEEDVMAHVLNIFADMLKDPPRTVTTTTIRMRFIEDMTVLDSGWHPVNEEEFIPVFFTGFESLNLF